MRNPVELTVDYDPERDVLFACVRPVPHTVSSPAADDVFWLREPTTGELRGFECLWFSRNVKDRDWLNRLPTEPTFYHLGSVGERLTLAQVLPELWRRAEERLQAALVMA